MLLSRHMTKVQIYPIDIKSLKDLRKQKNIDQNCKQPSRELNDKYSRFLEKIEIHIFSSVSSSSDRDILSWKRMYQDLFSLSFPKILITFLLNKLYYFLYLMMRVTWECEQWREKQKLIITDLEITQISQHVPNIRSEVKLLGCVRLFATPWTVAHQAPPSVEFSRQEQKLPFPSPRVLILDSVAN